MKYLTRKKVTLLFAYILLFSLQSFAYQPEFSTAGFYALPNTGRKAYSMDVAWRFYKGDVDKASALLYDDSRWDVVSLPHGIEYLPADASGGVNYQGVVWYRKHFTPEKDWKGSKLFLHFEAIMGKCKIWVNGDLLTEHFGGYLPVVVDISDHLNWGKDNIIAVCADNSDDPSFPPGLEQSNLDFTYFGGIYRDCWLIVHNKVFITDPNFENEVGGGGFIAAFDEVNSKKAKVVLKTQLRNSENTDFTGKIEYEIVQSDGTIVKKVSQKVQISLSGANTVLNKIDVLNPHLWTPESPYLYTINVRVLNRKGDTIDGYCQKIGIRSIEFKGKEGFWLNGKPYNKPLVGGNRHQDFAVVGNALANSTNWRDAKKLRELGFNVLRLSHYPQDPSFMDACDELGLFVIVPTPGWQFWNDQPIFGQRVESDIRNMVRRDRNHPSVLLWEPILNETGLWGQSSYTKEVQGKTVKIVAEEYPYNSCYSAGGPEEYFSVLYGGVPRPEKVYFTREYGDGGNVSDWHGQNGVNRANRAWGEAAMLIQAESYARSTNDVMSSFYKSPQHLGGCMWHSFDTQRAYHPDPFFGGLMDAFRQPKYAYYMFMSQRSPQKEADNIGSGPMVFIAHEMTPFSSKDVTVYSNCHEVRLSVFKDGKQYIYKKEENETKGLPSPVITFKNVFSYESFLQLSRSNKLKDVYLLAEGVIDGKVVATHRVAPSNRPEKIILKLDNDGVGLTADGSDFVTVVASIADANGNIKRLNNNFIEFSIEGEGRILGGTDVFANPRPVIWGDAPILVQSTTNAGPIKIRARVCFEGARTPVEGEIVFNSIENKKPSIYDSKELSFVDKSLFIGFPKNGKNAKKNADNQKLKKIQEQQELFLQK